MMVCVTSVVQPHITHAFNNCICGCPGSVVFGIRGYVFFRPEISLHGPPFSGCQDHPFPFSGTRKNMFFEKKTGSKSVRQIGVNIQ